MDEGMEELGGLRMGGWMNKIRYRGTQRYKLVDRSGYE